MKVKTLATSHIVTYLGKDGLISNNPFRSLHTKVDFPNGTLHTGSIMLVITEHAELAEL